MKRILLLVFSVQLYIAAQAQNCNSQRYQDTIFHDVTISTYKFGTATPFGLLAQPQDLYLDIYEPTGDTLSKRPIIVFQFGGGFTIGWRSEPVIPQFCDYFAKCGYVVASIDYRIGLNPADTNSTVRAYYRGVQDERSALRYLCQRAGQFRFDTSLITLTGTSAGCFCAFANGFTTDADRPASTFGSFLEPGDMGCMDCSGNNDFGKRIPRIMAIVNQWGAIMDTSLIEASENIPVLSFHGDQDILVPYVYGYPFQLPVFPKVYGSVPIHQRLTNLGIPNRLNTLEGYGHEPELLAPNLNDTIYNDTRLFLFDLLKPHTSAITGPATVCAGTTATYSVLNTPGSRYCWAVSDNGTIVANTGNSITVLWAGTGTAAVQVKELNYILAEGEEQQFTTTVVPHAQSSFTYQATELDVTFTNLSNDATTYNWAFGDGTGSTDAAPVTQSYTSGGTYTVSLVAANDYCADTSYNTFTIDSCPIARITYQLNNYNAFFYSPVTNTVSYFWNFGDGDSAAVASPNVFHQYAANGSYPVSLKVRNALGCSYTDTLTVTVNVTTTAVADVALSPVTFTPLPYGHVQVSGLPVGSNTNIAVYNLQGQQLYSTSVLTGSCMLPIGNMPAAVYIIKVTTGSAVITHRYSRP
jgi:PKD repeat protein